MTPSFLRLTVSLCVMFSCVAKVGAERAESGWEQLPTILKRIIPPTFPARDFDITDYGAREGGFEDCKPAFKKAIAACTRSGGGRVVVPEGVWLTNGPIHLDNNVNLHVSKNSTIRFNIGKKMSIEAVLDSTGEGFGFGLDFTSDAEACSATSSASRVSSLHAISFLVLRTRTAHSW